MPGTAERTTKDEVMTVLRVENRRLEQENASLSKQVLGHEKHKLVYESRAEAAEDVMKAAFEAVRILADQVSRTTAKGKQARAEARKVLESAGITPPGTLGKSRDRKKKRKRRRRKSLTRKGA